VIEALYSKYGPMVLRRCRRLLRDESQALDAMQDVYVLVLRHQLQDRASASLLFRLATNVCLNLLRTARRRPEDADDALVLQIAYEVDLESQMQSKRFLAGWFSNEPESTATILVLHFVDGLSWEEVAAAMNMSVSGVRKRARTVATRMKLSAETL
jgi:RNA polymerase sigma-70 factor, ECF subfamily